ncbi:hypothetical protein D043_2737B, partial [Vibrio parahaemolyticus EKP-021]
NCICLAVQARSGKLPA